jgi:hypothetical protein
VWYLATLEIFEVLGGNIFCGVFEPRLADAEGRGGGREGSFLIKIKSKKFNHQPTSFRT